MLTSYGGENLARWGLLNYLDYLHLKLCLVEGAKLAPFNSVGVWQNSPAKTDDALQQLFISGHYFSQ
jgi:hypothetical protein